MTFITTDEGEVNLDNIIKVQSLTANKVRYSLSDGSYVIGRGNADSVLRTTVVQICPCPQEWEKISICNGGDGEKYIFTKPIVAWALTALGDISPYAAEEGSLSDEEYFIRKCGEQKIYGFYQWYDNMEKLVGHIFDYSEKTKKISVQMPDGEEKEYLRQN